MTEQFARYRQLERRLWTARWINDGQESAEEDATLDEMEKTWLELSDEEQELLRREPPRCWPTESSSMPPQLTGGPYTIVPVPWAYEGFHTPLDAIMDAEAA